MRIQTPILIIIVCLLIISCKNETKESKKNTKNSVMEVNFIRKNAHSQDAEEDIKAYQIAMKKMKELPCENPLSWYYQGAMHWLPDSIPNNPLCDKYNETNDALKGWLNCTHADGAEIHFLIWHRLYIKHFEEIVRELSGKSDFALPYWDYTNPNYRKLPKMFSDKNSSLYESARKISLNNGTKIGDEMNVALSTNALFKIQDFKLFNGQIDGAPHGAMHVYIGSGIDSPAEIKWNKIYQSDTVGLMSRVASAGFDPIFWLHHSNIDRLWEIWERSPNGSRISLNELKKVDWPYLFFDSKGNEVKYTIEQAYDKAFSTDYVYDDLFDDEQPFIKDIVLEDLFVQEQDSTQIVSTLKKDISLATETEFTVKWDLPNKSNFKSFNENNRNLWVLNVAVSYDEAPIGIYEIYIKDKKISEFNQTEESVVGIMSFFGATHHKGMNHSMHEGNDIDKEFSFDITNTVDFEDFSGDVDFKILKQGGNQDDIVIKKITLEKRTLE